LTPVLAKHTENLSLAETCFVKPRVR
jgi:hypothetical protein